MNDNDTVIEEKRVEEPAPVEQELPPAIPQSAPLSLPAQVESLLYASKEPATINAIATALEVPVREIEDALEQLTEQYQWRGIRLQRQGNKLQLVTAPEIAPRIQKFLGLEEINKLSAAALETLAIVAYNQPMTKPQLEIIRGVNCDGVMNTLEARGLIVELGRADTVGHPMRYGVSFEFLQYFGLKSTHELPPVTQLETLPVAAVAVAAAGDTETSVIATPVVATPVAELAAATAVAASPGDDYEADESEDEDDEDDDEDEDDGEDENEDESSASDDAKDSDEGDLDADIDEDEDEHDEDEDEDEDDEDDEDEDED